MRQLAVRVVIWRAAEFADENGRGCDAARESVRRGAGIWYTVEECS